MEDYTAELVICRGLPASRKTSWALRALQSNPHKVLRVNRDDLRFMSFGAYVLNDPGKEKMITDLQHEHIRLGLMRRKKVIVDDTNLNTKTVKELVNIAAEFEGRVKVTFQDFPVAIDKCVANDKARQADGGRFVGEEVIRGMAKRYHVDRDGGLPSLPAHFYQRIEESKRLVQNPALPDAWLFDIDGTLASFEGRGPFDWDKVGEDHIIYETFMMLKALKDAGNAIVIATGRDGVAAADTREWLKFWDVPYDDFYIRAEGDGRKDSVIKKEILVNHILPKWNIVGCVDDRHQVVQMYRRLGLFVAQVGNGMF